MRRQGTRGALCGTAQKVEMRQVGRCVAFGQVVDEFRVRELLNFNSLLKFKRLVKTLKFGPWQEKVRRVSRAPARRSSRRMILRFLRPEVGPPYGRESSAQPASASAGCVRRAACQGIRRPSAPGGRVVQP